MIKCMFCNEKLLLLGNSSALDILIHDEYKKCSFSYKDVLYKPTIFRYEISNNSITTEYFFYNDICFQFNYTNDDVKLVIDDSVTKMFEASFLRSSFNISLVNNILDKVIENLLFS